VEEEPLTFGWAALLDVLKGYKLLKLFAMERLPM
jgi:hypothetical protein